MKRLMVALFSMTTLLVSSCGSHSVRKLKCLSYSINENDFSVSCTLVNEKYEEIHWKGYIDKWLVDTKERYTYWYELSNSEHYLKVGTQSI